MDFINVSLNHDWTLFVHSDCSVFVNVTDEDKYVVIDWDNDTIATLSVDENVCVFLGTYYGLKHEVDVLERTITLYHEPPIEEM